MAHEKLRPSYLFDEAKIAELKQIAPECFEDGKINFDTLKQNLGNWMENEDDPDLEHFGLFWPGKKQARKAAALSPEGTLEPVLGEGLMIDGTKDSEGDNQSNNIFIEGENLEVLKLLQKSYSGKIKMIYIDPPYNTGNDFVYDDDFTEPLQEYLRRTGQIDEEGRTLTTNKRSDGRFHSKWLSMMYPRLRLARNLLREDGFIFVSIDNNEAQNLKLLLNEIFGEENFIEQITWKKKYGGGAKSKYFVNIHEYIFCYCKNSLTIDNIEIPYDEGNRKYYKFKDEKFETRGPYRLQPLATNSNDERPNLRYPIIYNGKEVWPEKQWQWSKDRTDEALKNNELVFTEKGGSYSVNFKQYLKNEDGSERTTKPFSIIDGIYTQHGTTEIKEIFGDGQIFPFPKPTELITSLLDLTLSNCKDEIVLDFFAGSGSTAHSVLKFNENRERNYKYLLVQLPEQIDETSVAGKLGYRSISRLTAERIRRVSKETNLPDKGFRFYSLQPSNYKRWKNYNGTSITDLEDQLDIFNRSPLRDAYSESGLLTEVLLLEGFTLCSNISNLGEVTSNTVKRVTSNYCEHALLVCFDKQIQKETIDTLKLGGDDIFICLDSAISIEDKLRLSDKGLIKTI